MANKPQETRPITPVITPKNGVRIGSRLQVGDEYIMEVKHKKKIDHINSIELVELIEGRKVKKIVFYDNSSNSPKDVT